MEDAAPAATPSSNGPGATRKRPLSETEVDFPKKVPLKASGPPSSSEGGQSDDREGGADSSSESTSGSSSSSGEGSSSGSSSSSTSGSSSSEGDGAMDNLFLEDDYGRFLSVSCAGNEARFYLKRFARGSVGKCILFRSRWITPNEFQAISGRKSSKDWKRSIRLRGRCLKEFIAQRLFVEHQKNCVCKICSGEDPEGLRQEGEMALAAKRRRLSQADSLPPSEIAVALPPPPGSDSNSKPAPGAVKRGRGRPRKQPIRISPQTSVSAQASQTVPQSPPPPPGSTSPSLDTLNASFPAEPSEQQKIWSPSGEVAPDGGSSNEDEYKPVVESQPQLKGVVDQSDFIPRRSRRTAHRKHTGHRTEMGTFTRKPADWDAEEVGEFLQLQGFGDYVQAFADNEIDGQSLFLLKEAHLMDRFEMKLGPALRLLDTISRLKHPPVSFS